ncbi:MAG: hypothetical protein R3190_14885 [Thermoanaerobaculia bacterium]|nr:hypothetical protein [Thermoanaerobaculia bacterium]
MTGPDTAPAPDPDPCTAWWGEHDLEPGHGIQLSLGTLELVVYRADKEWRLAQWQIGADDPNPQRCRLREINSLPQEHDNLERFAAGSSSGSLSLRPRAANRSVVARPRVPLHVLPGENAEIYVSAPIWIEVLAGRPLRTLRDLPIKRLSDTWFGAVTGEGEAAYSLGTQARSMVEEVPIRSHRAVTPVVVENRAEDLLLLDRMNLPVPYLSIYSSAESHLWTETVTLRHSADSALAALDVRRGAPRVAQGAKRVGEPRRTPEKNLLVRAFGGLLHGIEGGG